MHLTHATSTPPCIFQQTRACPFLPESSRSFLSVLSLPRLFNSSSAIHGNSYVTPSCRFPYQEGEKFKIFHSMHIVETNDNLFSKENLLCRLKCMYSWHICNSVSNPSTSWMVISRNSSLARGKKTRRIQPAKGYARRMKRICAWLRATSRCNSDARNNNGSVTNWNGTRDSGACWQ